MSKELLVIEELNPVDIFKANGIQPILDRIKEEVSAETPDISTTKGRARIASNAFKVSQSKALLEKMGKALTDDLNAKKAPIMGERNLSKDFLDALRDEIRKPLTEWEAAEEKRSSDLTDRIMAITEHSSQYDLDSTTLLLSQQLKAKYSYVNNLVIDDSFAERELEAIKAKESSLALLLSHITKAEKLEAEQIELERLRKESVEREQKEHDDRIAQEAADKAKAEAEALAKQEAERVEKERLKGIAREAAAKEAQAQAERDKVAAEERAKAEKKAAEEAAIEATKQAKLAEERAAESAKQAEILRQKEEQKAEAAALAKREANKAHKKRTNNEAVKSLVDLGTAVNMPVSKELAQKIVIAIALGEIKNVVIGY